METLGSPAPAGDGAAPRAVAIRGAILHRAHLDRGAQERMAADILAVAETVPFIHPVTRWGKPMSVGMTSAGTLGWISDRRGYRYEPRHPSGTPWPAIPECVLAVWDAVCGTARRPDCCLINLYRGRARMGLHQDRDEASFDWPVLSISLGDEALFRIGGPERGGGTESVWLRSGDVLWMGGAARMAYHGIDRVRAGSSDLIEGGGRINLTLRVVT